MKCIVRKVLSGLLALSATSFVMAEENTQAIAWNCANCHSGLSGDLPSLTKSTPQEIELKLLQFKHQATDATIMPRLVKGYSDEVLHAIAEQVGAHPK